jgi:branched-chain amino acid transport system permease protein
MNATLRKHVGTVPTLVAVALIAVFPAFGGKFYVDLMMTVMILAVFALSLEILVGTTGLVSFGHAAFFGIGAYAAALLSPRANAPSLLWLLPAAMGASACYALLVGALSLRTRGVYFIMVTLAFAQMAYYVFHDTALGRGSDGVYLNVKPVVAIAGAVLLDLDRPLAFYYFTLLSLVATFGFLTLLIRSRFGRALAGIKADEQRMRAAGFSTYPYKLAAFVIAGALAGLAGFLYAVKDGFVNPELLAWHQSGAVLLMVILGGIGSLRGAVIGAFAFVLLKEVTQSEIIFGAFARHWQLLLGLAIIASVGLMPNGLIGLAAQWRRADRHAA